MPARSQNRRESLLIAAISGRALAEAARRAGYRPLVADLFRDIDTVAAAERAVKLAGDLHNGIDGGRLLETLKRLAGKEEPAAILLGSGFEREPGLVDEIGRHFPLAGNGGAAIRRVKDPLAFAADCAEMDIPHPEIRLEAPADPENWVVKKAGGAGGAHIGRANGALPPGSYFQRHVAGEAVSALFVADGTTARVAGFSRQWTAPAPGAHYRYGGAVRLRRFERRQAAMIAGWLSALAARVGLVGLCSADFIRDDRRWQLVEINPRPGATLDIFDDGDAPLIEAHIRASRGEEFRLPRYRDAAAATIVYADQAVERFPEIAWPDWTADRQPAGTRLSAGDPVCTAIGRGSNAAAARRLTERQASAISQVWQGGRT